MEAREQADTMWQGEHFWTAPHGKGPRNHPRLKNLNLPPLGDFLDGESVLEIRTVRQTDSKCGALIRSLRKSMLVPHVVDAWRSE